MPRPNTTPSAWPSSQFRRDRGARRHRHTGSYCTRFRSQLGSRSQVLECGSNRILNRHRLRQRQMETTTVCYRLAVPSFFFDLRLFAARHSTMWWAHRLALLQLNIPRSRHEPPVIRLVPSATCASSTSAIASAAHPLTWIEPQLEGVLRYDCDAFVYTVDPALLATASAAAEAHAEFWAVLRAAMPDVYATGSELAPRRLPRGQHEVNSSTSECSSSR